MAPHASAGILFVISAPSGTGKSTVAHRLLERVPELDFSVSYTTRPRRDGEREGHDYHFDWRELNPRQRAKLIEDVKQHKILYRVAGGK